MDQGAARALVIDTLAHSVGAVMLSRACPDGSPLADEILDACRAGILAPPTHGNGDRSEAEPGSLTTAERSCRVAWRGSR